MMLVRVGSWVGLVIVLATLVPTSQASQIPSYTFRLDVHPLSVEPNKTANKTIDFTLMTGRVAARGDNVGLFGIVNATTNDSTIRVDGRIEVVDTAGAQARFMAGKCTNPQECVIRRTFYQARLRITQDSSLLVYANTPVLHQEAGAFALASVILPSEKLGGGAVKDLKVANSLLLVGANLTATGSWPSSQDAMFAYMPNNRSAVTITDATGTETYAAGDLVFRMYGAGNYTSVSAGLLAPFNGTANADFRPVSNGLVRRAFQPEALNQVVRSLGANASVVPPQVATGLKDFAPILNGVFTGRASGITIANKDFQPVNLTIVRFSSMAMIPTATGATLSGKSNFLLMGEKGFYTTKKGATFGVLKMPALSLTLWLIAAAAIILGFVLKPMIGGPQFGGMGTVRLVGILFHAVALVLAVLLWDHVIGSFLGTSLLTLFSQNALGHGTILIVTAVFELTTFGLAHLLFGMPLRFIVNSGLKLAGLKKARGVGKGIGNLATWALGAPFIPLILNGFIGAILASLQKAVGAG